MTCKTVRLRRIMSGMRTILAPLDHGVGAGPINGLTDMRKTVSNMCEGGANAVVVHKGVVKAVSDSLGNMGLIVHCSASTSISADPNAKTLVCSVEEAIQRGADAVSIHVNLGADSEQEMLGDFAVISQSCNDYNIPLLAMMYVRGHDVKDTPENIAIAARCAYELGADIIKVPYTGSPKNFRKVVEGCGGIPVVIAGGEKMATDHELLGVVAGAMEAGASGLSIGRNVFQHENPEAIVRAMAAIVHGGKSVDEALKLLKAA